MAHLPGHAAPAPVGMVSMSDVLEQMDSSVTSALDAGSKDDGDPNARQHALLQALNGGVGACEFVCECMRVSVCLCVCVGVEGKERETGGGGEGASQRLCSFVWIAFALGTVEFTLFQLRQ